MILRALPIELRPSLLSVHFERALLADRVWPLKDPVLPRREPPEDLRLHRLRAGEAKVGFETRHCVWRKRRARLDRLAHLVVPVDFVRCERDEPGLLGLRGVERTRVRKDLRDLRRI